MTIYDVMYFMSRGWKRLMKYFTLIVKCLLFTITKVEIILGKWCNANRF